MRRGQPPRWSSVAMALAVLFAVAAWPGSTLAAHESTNTLIFEAVDGSSASGDGLIEYRGGGVLDSRWTVQLRFRGLQPNATYVAVIKGRFGATDTPGAETYSELCTIQTSPAGEGGCWWYLVQMQHVDIVQLRVATVDGSPIVQATRREDGPGSITSVPNAFSPPESSPAASPVTTPVASPSPVDLGAG